MQTRTLWILLSLVVGLAAFVWFVERDLPGSDERAERAKRMFDVELDEISRVSWARGDERVELSRSGGAETPTWRLEAPFTSRVESADVERLLDLLAGLEKERTLESGAPGDLGLDPPRATLTLVTEAGELRLAVGGAVPASESMIVAAGDGPPYHVVAGDLWAELERPASDWRSRDVLHGESGDVARFSVGGADRLDFVRRGQDFWLEAPITDLADEGTVSRFLSALTGLEVEEFVDGSPDLERYGLAPAPAGVIEVERIDGSSWRLELGAGSDTGEGGQIYARTEDAVIRIADLLGEDMVRAADEWRSLDWATLKVFEVDGVEVVDEVGDLSFERINGEWVRDAEPVEFNVVSDLLYAITGTKAEALDAERSVTSEPVLTVVLNPGAGEERLEVFEPQADRFPARNAGRETVLLLGGDRVRDIRSRIADARAAEALDSSESAPSEASAPEEVSDG